MRIATRLMGMVLLFYSIGCSPVPITDGYHSELSEPGTHIIVWGNHPAVIEMATTWLKKRGLITLDPASIGTTLKQDEIRWNHTFQDEIAILHSAQELGAEQVVFANRIGDQRAPGVSVRGVRVETNHVIWIGSGRMPEYVKDPQTDLLAKLTCQALATAWGYRPPGQKRFTSSLEMCAVEEDEE